MDTQWPTRTTMLLLVGAILGLAQWFFGNLYEAIAVAPNWRIGFEYQLLTGQSQHAERIIFYYVPITQLALICLWIATILERRSRWRWWLGGASLLGLTALLLTAYIVTQLNLQLFFGSAPPALERVAELMQIWQALNYIRLVLVGSTLIATANGLRLLYRDALLQGRGPSLASTGTASL